VLVLKQILVATVACSVCHKPLALLDAQECPVGERPRKYPGEEPIQVFCCREYQIFHAKDVRYLPLSRLRTWKRAA